MDGEVAHLTLVDSNGLQSLADYSAKELAAMGIGEGTRFTCTIKKRSHDTVVTFTPIPKRQLSSEEWRKLRQETKEKVGDYDPKDDY